MSRLTQISVSLLVSGLLIYSCGSEPGLSTLPPADYQAFRLEVTPDSTYKEAGSARYGLRLEDSGGDLLVHIDTSQARGLKALFCQLSYDPQLYHPLSAAAPSAPYESADMLAFSYLDDPGQVYYAMALTQPERHSGLSGNVRLATVRFERGAAASRSLSGAPPRSPQSNPLLAISPDGVTLSWYYRNQGDYNQDCVVDEHDIAPLALHFREPATDAPNGPLAVIDGNEDGLLNISDLSAIGANFHCRVDRYTLHKCYFRSEWPEHNTDPSGLTEYDHAPFDNGVEQQPGGRKMFLRGVAPDINAYFWVRATDTADPLAGESREGATSNIATIKPDVPRQPRITLDAITPAEGGDGKSNYSPYLVNPGSTYLLRVFWPIEVNVSEINVSTDPKTDFSFTRVSYPADLSVVRNTEDVSLSLPPGVTGTFSVSASYDGVSSGNRVYFLAGPVTDTLFIKPAPVDSWVEAPNYGQPNAGSSSNPYVLHSDGYNTELTTDGVYSLSFPVRASNTDIPWSDLPPTSIEWLTKPPGLIDFDTSHPVSMSFRIAPGVSCEVYGRLGGVESNHIFVTSAP